MQLVAESMMYSQTYGYLFSRRASPPFGRYENYTAYVTEACVCERLADGRYTTASADRNHESAVETTAPPLDVDVSAEPLSTTEILPEHAVQ